MDAMHVRVGVMRLLDEHQVSSGEALAGAAAALGDIAVWACDGDRVKAQDKTKLCAKMANLGIELGILGIERDARGYLHHGD